jgi:hypothetical protein
MTKYRSKKVTYVEAYQFKLGMKEEAIGVLQDVCMPGISIYGAIVEGNYNGDGANLYCNTLSGRASVKDGDFIIHNKKDDEYYPCNPKTFHEKYELTGEEDEEKE